MSILLLRGPDCVAGHRGRPARIAAPVMRQLLAHAGRAGKTLAVRGCASERELLQALAQADQAGVEMLLLDPGACSDSAVTADAVAHLRRPYVEVHDDASDRREACLCAASGQRLGQVGGYCAQGYALALSIALEHLGCNGYEGDVHVGT
ncbi:MULTISPECIES: type II 3-dehydroquinate dehydratase [Xanthomonas]|uniref:3-dehydroquinate dehydratase n=1 Tax=Xanthomonas sacchari TaxID=56458 RepID=A0A2P5YZW0_9XANT|nr:MULTISPECIES: type II 3-dehydroquinate dehydratase [Xanthomonas]MCC4589714.1 type II 3-dehydroquinate dehydratase [Xanthomonas campestris pv. cannae]MBO9882827.1 type II 3-dehydroquinate dehydratase [Xanthomonas sp. D-109]MCW0394007.1 Catabolic 3-dehydroquinase [Xanthomonas sacchari]MCW0424796.1 Catabolic 3-dehydroquinase [Xanthomonas sacchari]MCW0446785.1 Catabolic 3-dehydroquinase [Xanthomonas sacchari]